MINIYRRCIVYPFYRNWKLIDQVFEDLKNIFSLGKSLWYKNRFFIITYMRW